MNIKIFVSICAATLATNNYSMQDFDCLLCTHLLSKKFIPQFFHESALSLMANTQDNELVPGQLVLIQAPQEDTLWEQALITDQPLTDLQIKVHRCKDHTCMTVDKKLVRPFKKIWPTLWQPKPSSFSLNASFMKLFEVFNRPPYPPRVLAQILNQSTRIVTIGDLHGSSRSLRTIIKALFKRRILDHNLHLRDDYVMVFTGDYTDRGPRGPETWDILAKLKKENPITVVLLRGNHETLTQALKGNFFNQMISSTLCNLPIAQSKTLLNKLFEALPLGICLGTRACTNKPFHFIMFCHGGIYQVVPLNLLLITTIKNYQKKPPKAVLAHLAHHSI